MFCLLNLLFYGILAAVTSLDLQDSSIVFAWSLMRQPSALKKRVSRHTFSAPVLFRTLRYLSVNYVYFIITRDNLIYSYYLHCDTL